MSVIILSVMTAQTLVDLLSMTTEVSSAGHEDTKSLDDADYILARNLLIPREQFVSPSDGSLPRYSASCPEPKCSGTRN